MSVAILLAALAVGLSAAMAVAWLVARRSGNHGWVDAIWSLATGAAAVLASLVPLGLDDVPLRRWLVVAMAATWSLRLGGHIVARARSGQDDPRYADLVRGWGDAAASRLFWFLQIQAAAGWVLAAAVMAAARSPLPLGVGDAVGVAILVASVAGAAIADRELARFRADPANRGRTCDVGLWGRTRHPNYFFEWLGWTAYPVIAIDLAGGSWFGFAALAAPVLMYWLLVHASGIPPTEAHMLRSRGAAFRDYQRRVNAFWPGPRRRQPPAEPAR
jgi:steroid 5-alpha reductase family enzyme